MEGQRGLSKAMPFRPLAKRPKIVGSVVEKYFGQKPQPQTIVDSMTLCPFFCLLAPN